MKVIGISGSPKKKDSTTLFALEKAMEQCKEAGLETEIIDLSEYRFNGCIDCSLCKTKIDCSQNDDYKEHIMPLLNDENIKGFIFASPVYFGGVTAQMKALMDRMVMFRRNGFMYENVVAGALSVGRSRHGGQELTSMDIVKNAMIQGMIVVPDASPTSHFGGNLWSGHPDTIENDDHGIKTSENLGKKVAEIVKKLS